MLTFLEFESHSVREEWTLSTNLECPTVHRSGRPYFFSWMDNANSFQVESLASAKLKDIKSSTESIDTQPVIGSKVPTTVEDFEALNTRVIRNNAEDGE